MKQYSKYMKPYLAYFILGPIFMIVEVIGEVLMPRLMSNIVDVGVPSGDRSYIIRVGLTMLGLALVMMLGGVLGALFAVKASVNFAADLRQDVFNKVQNFSFANLEKFHTGSLVTRLTNDITNMQNVICMALRMMLRAPGMLIGGMIMAFMMNARLALVLGVVVPILGILLFVVMRTAFPRFDAMQGKIDHVNSILQENVTNVRVVKSFVRKDYEIDKFGDANENLRFHSIRAMKVVILTMPLMTLAMNLTTIAVVWFGGKQIMIGSFKVGQLIAFTTYITQILMSMMMVSMVLIQGSRALASSRRIKEVLNTELTLTDEDATHPAQQVTKGRIEFRDVCFRYYKDNENEVLSHLNFTIEPGQTVGIIGSTGSGKTSLVQLIPRLYDVTNGMVLVDDMDVRDYSIRNLRESIGMVLQKNVLFSGTIEENLRWGKEDAEQEELQQFAEYAQADSFIQNFTDGYKTELGQGGVNVSGGQKQRICIARALLKQPKILILDDSTSAVDTATEARIRECFSHGLAHTTKLIIAQRISSVSEADQILVLEEGQIVGRGTHEELLKNCGEYREIYDSQMEKEAAV